MSASTLRDICFDCTDNRLVARFWAEMLGYPAPELDPTTDQEESICINPPGGGLRIWFNAVPEPKTVKNRVHLDVTMSDEAELGRLIARGATPLQEIRGEDGILHWSIMADPEGNEFCAFPPTS
jgi:hypothetical protein